MNNTVTYENPLRKRMKKAMAVLVLLAIVFAVALIVINLVTKQTLNGNVTKAEGVVDKIDTSGDTTFIYLQNSNTKYNTNPIDGLLEDLDSLVGKNVVLYTPAKQFGGGDPMVFGIEADGEKLLDYQQVIEDMRQSYTAVLIAFAVVCGVFAGGVCALGIARMYVQREKQYPLGEKYVEFYAEKQPNCPEMKYLKIFTTVWIVAMFAPLIIMSIWNSIEEQSNLINFIFMGVMGGIIVFGVVVFLLLKRWVAKKNMEFYAQHFPFDFADLSHVKMKKDVREKIEAEMREDLIKHPHYQGDGGNGYLTKFTPNGVELYIPDFWYENEQENAEEQTQPVSAADVFGLDETAATVQDGSPAQTEEKAVDDGPKQPPVLTLTYKEVNFEAVPYLKKPRPMFVVIKSRLEPSESYPKELINDLHFLLDVNLLKTLQTFDVPVENLDNILQNKKQLIEEAYAKRKQKDQ